MSVGRGWKIISWNARDRAILWIFFGLLLVQGTLGESTNNATDADTPADGDADSDDVEVVSLVKKDKRQAQRGYTDVPLDQGPFDELIASSPAPIAFENDLPTFVDSLSDIADATPPDYNGNKFQNYGSATDRPGTGPPKDASGERQGTQPTTLSTPGPSTSPSSQQQTVIIASNSLGSISNVSKPQSFFNQNQFQLTSNNGVPFGPVSSGTGFGGPGITPTGRLTDSLALPDNTAAAANIERRQVELPLTPNEPPPFNGKAIPGEAGIDYPIFGEIPRTSFSCKDQAWPGYYADTQARCQVFWICQKHRMDGFLCPNGTLFNQQVFVCDWWFNVDCSAAPEFYSRNQFVYAGPGIGIDGQPVRGLSLPISATNRVANVLPPLPPPIRNNALLGPPTGQGTQVQSSNQVSRVAPVTARPPEFQSRADSLNNFLKSGQTTGPGQSYQSQLVSRLQSNPNRLHDTVSIVKSTSSPPLIPSKDKDRRIPSASSQITHSHVSGTSRPTIVSSYQPQHVETVSIVTTPNPTTRTPTQRPPPPPIPKFNISPTLKPIKGPSPSPFGNVIKLGTTVTISTTPRPDFSTKTSLFKGIISSTIKPSKSGILKLSNSNLLGSNSQTKAVSLNRPSPTPTFHARPVSTEDPTNTVRPPDYSPQRAPDPTPTAFSAPGYLPSSRPHSYVDSVGFGRESKQQHYFVSSTGRPQSAHGMRSNQFSNVHGQRENIYASSRKDTFVEFPYSPSQQKNKQKLAELASSKDISSSKAVVTAIPHFYGQRSNVFSGADSLSYISNNNKRVIIDHTHYSQRQGPFKSPGHGKVHHQNVFPPGSAQPPLHQHIPQHSTSKPRHPPQQYIDSTGPSPSRPTPTLLPPPHQQQQLQQQHQQQLQQQHQQQLQQQHQQQHQQQLQQQHQQQLQQHHQQQQHHHIQQQLQVSSKPEQRFIVTFSSTPPPQHIPSSTTQYHRALPQPQPSPSVQLSQVAQQQHHHQLPAAYTRNDAVTPREGFTPLNAGSFISIQTTAPPFSQQILKHNSLHPYQEGHKNGGTVVAYSSTGPPPTPQQVIFSSPPTNNNPFVSSTAAPRAFDHGPPPQQNIFSSTPQPYIHQSSPPPYYEHQGTPTPQPQISSTPYSTPNNFIAAPTQSPFLTTSPGHRQNPYLPHNHGKHKNKQHHRPPPPPPPTQPSSSLSASNPVSFPHGGITTTIKYPEGTGKLRLDFSGGGANRKNIVDFTYSASPTSTTPSNYIGSSTTPYPAANDRFTQSVSSTTVRPIQQSSFPPPGTSGRGPGGRYAGAVTNKSNLSSSAIYVDTAAAAESVSTPVTVPSPSSPTSSPLPPVSTSNYGLRLSATAKKRMTGAWQSYFSSKSE